jgi:lactate racemase
MRVDLAYGKHGLSIDLPDAWDVTVIEPRHVAGLPDPRAALRGALRAPIAAPPLAELARPGQRVGIVVSDITRPTPHPLILPAVLGELAHLPAAAITLFNALGTHRPNTDAELRGMLGDGLVDAYRIVQNDCFDPSTQVRLGVTSRGHEAWLNRELVDCDLIVLTGFIEPHFFAGFSGGGKAVMPGMAGLPTILANHGPAMIGDPHATWGVTHGNPVWEDVREVAGWLPRAFLVNVALNKDKAVTGVFAGGLGEAHARGCAFVKEHAMVPVAGLFDIVITTNSGHPLDLNLYQSVKGMSAAAQVVKPGGAIVLATDCWDGLPEHGPYSQLLREAASPQDLLERVRAPGFLRQDQWQAQIQAQIQQRAEVYVYTDHLTDAQVRGALLRPCPSIEATVADLIGRHGPAARICVLPQGPQTIPFVR